MHVRDEMKIISGYLNSQRKREKRRRAKSRSWKRVHDGGYKNVRDRLWKSLVVHTEVFEEWTRVREECDFYILPDFPKPTRCPQDQTLHFPPFCVFAPPAAA